MVSGGVSGILAEDVLFVVDGGDARVLARFVRREGGGGVWDGFCALWEESREDFLGEEYAS